MTIRFSDSDLVLLEQMIQSVAADIGGFGKRFYEHFFRAHPEVRRLFRRSRDEQTRHLVDALHAIVRHARSPEAFDEFAVALAGVHVGYGVREEHYPWMNASLLVAFEQTLGRDWSPALERAWRAAYSLVEERVHEALDEIGGASRTRHHCAPPTRLDPLQVVAEYLRLSRSWRSGIPLSIDELRRWRAVRRQIERLVRAPLSIAKMAGARALRVPTRMSVTFSSGERSVAALMTDVAKEGLFIATDHPLAPGTPLRLEIAGALSGGPVDVQGVVSWTRDGATSQGPAGMGVRLHELNERQECAMLRLVEQALCLRLSALVPEVADGG